MKKLVLVGMFSAVTWLPATAMAQTPTRQHVIQYTRAYRQVRSKLGHRAPGCNLLRTCHERVTDEKLVASLAVLERMLEPAVSWSTQQTIGTPSSVSTPISSNYTGGYAIPTDIVMCESGGNWRAVNPSSGAGGAYQILPSTWASHGGVGLPQNASPAEQSRIAAIIWNGGAGRGQWSC